MRYLSRYIILFLGIAFLSATVFAEDVSYTRDIKPILSNQCFACHGPDAKHREADLRLDIRESALDSAISEGNASKSELIARILSDDDEIRMPPPTNGKPKLSAKQVKLLTDWINQGAKFEKHWAYQPPSRVDPPEVTIKDWSQQPIDAFIAAGHAAQGMKPNPQADKRTLIRRLYFDITGLPPTPAEVAEFEADEASNAYEKVVDRLLASEAYGERMAAFWLDQVRYADTNGIHGDNHRDHAPYRSYVIESFHSNKPFDIFTREQLAGDLLPSPTREQRIASGYNRLNMTTREGGAQAKEYLAKYSADRVRNASTVWLGSTLGCAECHDHKFDPFLTKDFYSFGAFFADVQETAVGSQAATRIPTAEQEQQLAELSAQIAEVQKQLNETTPEIAAAQSKWEETALSNLNRDKMWQTLKPENLQSAGGVKFAISDDHSVLTSGPLPQDDTYTVELQAKGKVTGLRLEALTHESLTKKSLSRANGNFVLSEFEVFRVEGDKETAIRIASAIADFEQNGWPVKTAIDGKKDNGWAVSGHTNIADRMAVFVLGAPIEAESIRLRIKMTHASSAKQHLIGRFRLATSSVDQPNLSGKSSLPNDVTDALKLAADKRTAAQRNTIEKYYRSIAPALTQLRQKESDLQAQKKKIADAGSLVLITKAGKPREMRVLPRGNWLDDSGEVVSPNTPSFLPPLKVKDRRATRLDLANWLVSPDHPLTSRVFVNRLWKVMFGSGLAPSLDDFGSQGVAPLHPELLDWLAIEFVESGWDVKHMVKLMAMSNAYQQSSMADAAMREHDPANRWLARQARYRFDAEVIRDNALAFSGLLSREVGGVSVKPYQPSGYWSHLNFPKRTWKHDAGTAQYRRGLYTYWCRTFLHPSMLAFDAPSREESCVLRNRSNTPQQALVLLNDPTYVEAARGLGERMIRQGGDSVTSRVAHGYQLALQREPRREELEILTKVADSHSADFTANPKEASAFLGVGLKPEPTDLDPVELATWTAVARVLINLHETVTRQ